MSADLPTTLPRLELPRRWEFLEQRAADAKIDPAEIVERVDDAANRVDELLRRVRDGGGGVIEVFYGLSGSGKTTFLQTLSRFFVNIRVSTFSNNRQLSDLPRFISADVIPNDPRNRIILIERRDNPTAADLAAVEETFSSLLNTFREPGGAAVVLWPITKPESAKAVADAAWTVGRDSMADEESRGQYHFRGVPSSKYWDLADNTSRSLTGDSLEAYGITKKIAADVLPGCETISDFFGRITQIANAERDRTWSVLKVRSIPHLWVALPGDDLKALNATADALTQGIQSKVDIDKIGELIDQADESIIYISEWKERRGRLAHLLRAIDTRLFGVPANVSVAAVRAFGDTNLKAKLKQPEINIEAAKTAMKASRLYKAILRETDKEVAPFAGSRRIGQETVDDFIRIQTVASKDDKPLNKALAALIAACLRDDAPELLVTSEKRALPGSALQPDIQIELRPGEFICIEPTWRTSGRGLNGEIKESQNTLSEAHMKKYMLEKATQYVKGFGL
ncbi:ATP-binding protein [Methylosinus sp. LW4]|uniref:ATP-binding protein n=1 Tax=Methylosinus sp. LW4 TaxID=136993 RepID=UPI0003AA12F2|nr:ATP-binding protein [Methylosinus sp. LW4]